MDEWTNFGIPRIPLAAQINTGGGTERLLAAGELPAPIRNLPDARRQLARSTLPGACAGLAAQLRK